MFGVEATLSLQSSHNIAYPGFRSQRGGIFNLESEPADDRLELAKLTLLDVELTRLIVESQTTNGRKVIAEFERRNSEAGAHAFVQQLADAWSAELARDQSDPWYGNLYIDIDWSGVKTIAANSGGISTSLQMSSQQDVPIKRDHLESLRWTPLTDLFVEGVKSSRPKSKFLFWFLMLEELEKKEEFEALFTPMFGEAEKQDLRKAVAENSVASNRLNGLLNNTAATIEGRPAKLRRILEEIGVSEVEALQRKIPITDEICKRLINQRNKVAHKGSEIDSDLLYNVLFPLSKRALDYHLQ
ncbi:hypothetical protein D3C72_899660 [compost metagenome]